MKIIENIVVKTINKQTHELKINLKYPYVSDVFVWKDKTNKSKGYSIRKGRTNYSIESSIESKKKN